MRATATAILFFAINLLGLGIGPTLAGWERGVTNGLRSCVTRSSRLALAAIGARLVRQ